MVRDNVVIASPAQSAITPPVRGMHHQQMCVLTEAGLFVRGFHLLVCWEDVIRRRVCVPIRSSGCRVIGPFFISWTGNL